MHTTTTSQRKEKNQEIDADGFQQVKRKNTRTNIFDQKNLDVWINTDVQQTEQPTSATVAAATAAAPYSLDKHKETSMAPRTAGLRRGATHEDLEHQGEPENATTQRDGMGKAQQDDAAGQTTPIGYISQPVAEGSRAGHPATKAGGQHKGKGR